jgi:hypothetical protein
MAPAFAKDDAPLMPSYVLGARTVAVVIDTEAGISLRDPNANQTARKDVETALQNWGRYQIVMDPRGADLIIVIRKGTKPQADITIVDPRQNRRGGMVEPLDDGISVGVQRGPNNQTSRTTRPVPQGPADTKPVAQAGTPGDVFQVFNGKLEDPLNSPAGWQYVKNDGLHSHDVPSVAAFRKAVADAEKQAAQQKGNHP